MAIAFVDPLTHPYTFPFYGMFPREPVRPAGHILVTPRSVPGMTVEKLLRGLASSQVGLRGEVLFVCHGTTSGLSLSIGSAKNRVFLQTTALDAMNANLLGKVSDEWAANRLKLEKK